MKKQRIVVVGNGMVGHKFIEDMLAQEGASEFEIITFSEEPRLAYDRVQLSHYFSGKTASELALTDEQRYQQQGIRYVLGEAVTDIDHRHKRVITASGLQEGYDTLVLATGSFPFVPPIPGNNQQHCHVYRTIEDLKAIEESGSESDVGVVVGGGLLGLEAANALKSMGLATHVVEFAPQLMAVQLDSGGGELLRQKIEALGVHVHTGKATTEIVAGECCRYRMNFADGAFLETDMIIFSAGIRPQDSLARQSGIEVGPRGGIVIDDFCQASIPDIYAIGECALWQERIFGLVAPGYQMAKVVASNLALAKTSQSSIEPESLRRFSGADMSTKLKLLGVDVASIGDVNGGDDNAQSYTYSDGIEQVYKRLILSPDGDKVVGAVLVGDVESYSTLLQTKLNDLPLPDNPAVLILPQLASDTESRNDAVTGIDALPDSAPICSCYDVTKGDIRQAVAAGCSDMAALKSATKASTGCGGCAALAKQVMDAELVALGAEVDDHLCEHFAFSRRELADIVRIKRIKTFDDLISSHGNGLGCDVCKPAVGSILASFWNDYVLEDRHMELQDTNDIYLGNMQKDGTYSVVPRIPGGEITPDKLIVLGEVAKQFELYTKITGAQRVDLFGAQLHQLPQIWQRLVAAGFETGHAYGKSVRTVKSCVGSTWCRYGVKDSVGFAIDLENRYKGLRAPHKLKFAVSGCTRECAEAQSKDIGVIATENGWNLYVCGNGGMRPRHADLFASDLDGPTLIAYVDRLLMFYIRTADRLQRTSVWLENLEGGLGYLKQVVIDDTLGIAAELEADMTETLGRYQCEWKTTLESPEKLRRFRHFLNSDQGDDKLAYVIERGQRRPLSASERHIDIVDFTGEGR